MFLLQLNEKISLNSSLTYTYGRLKDGDVPLDHIPPMFGKTSLKFETKKFKAEVYARYNGWKHLEDYSASGEDNLPQATVDGTPSWYTLNCVHRLVSAKQNTECASGYGKYYGQILPVTLLRV